MASLMESNPWPKLKDILPTHYYCDVCEVTMMYRDHKIHIRGKRHRQAEKAAEPAAVDGAADSNGYSAPATGGAPAADGGQACFNCGQTGHRKADCTEPRSAANVVCRRCNQKGHYAKDCPNGDARGGDAGMQCRNCDQYGHKLRECPEPRDYSRVKCNICDQMGHTKVRCKAPIREETFDSYGGDTNGGFDTGGIAPSGDWDAAGPAVAEGGWDNGGDAPAETNSWDNSTPAEVQW